MSGCSSRSSAASCTRSRSSCLALAASSPTSLASNSPASCSARPGEAINQAAAGGFRLWRRCRLSRRGRNPRRLPQRALHQGDDELVNTYKPEILLLGATTLGRDLAGSVATTLLTGLTADCTELDVDADGSLAATRPTFGGSLLCTIYTLNYRPQMATVRPRVMPMPERVEGRDRAASSAHPRVSSRTTSSPRCSAVHPRPRSAKSNLAYADVVVAGGLGLEIAGEFPAGAAARLRAGRRIWLLAAAGAEGLGHFRSADRPDRQDHPAETLHRRRAFRARSSIASGWRARICIVAINTDKNAPIFGFAHVGIVTDAIRLLPALTEAFRERLSPHSRDRLAG